MAGTTKGSLVERTSEVLNKAADLIEQRGWTKGCGWQLTDFDNGTDAICLEGAIQLAAGFPAVPQSEAAMLADRVRFCPAGQAVVTYLADADRHDRNGWLFTWNDQRSDAAEVIEVLRACAVIEQAREEQDAAWATYAGLVTA
jgi:hypothetical protein